MKGFEEKLVQALRGKRAAEGLSLRALSAKIGVSFSTLARIERGEGSPDNNSKIRILEWLGTDAQEAGLGFENVALVHFRAGKNAESATIKSLLGAAACLKQHYAVVEDDEMEPHVSETSDGGYSKEELERTAERFRQDLNLDVLAPIDSLRIVVEGVTVEKLTLSVCLDQQTKSHLAGAASTQWSAMSVPLNEAFDRWVVLLNDSHTIERQRVTILEEFWHIMLGHKLTKISRVAGVYGRTYDNDEEHDAYYLASATLLPRDAVVKAVEEGCTSQEIAARFGTSVELVDYRIKRLGLWRNHVGRKVSLG